MTLNNNSNHSKTRARSVQLQLDREYSIKSSHVVVRTVAGPIPAARSSSLRDQDSRPPPVSTYRSMLDVDAPNIGPLQLMVYDELYPPGCIADDGTTWFLEGSCNTLLSI